MTSKNKNFDNGNSKFPINFKYKVQSKSKQKKYGIRMKQIKLGKIE